MSCNTDFSLIGINYEYTMRIFVNDEVHGVIGRDIRIRNQELIREILQLIDGTVG